jgi:hypothetical protein
MGNLQYALADLKSQFAAKNSEKIICDGWLKPCRPTDDLEPVLRLCPCSTPCEVKILQILVSQGGVSGEKNEVIFS